MHSKLLISLMEGNFICKQTHSDWHEHLSNDNNLMNASLVLENFGRKLVATKDGSAYYLCNSNPLEVKDSLIRQTMESAQSNISLYVKFIHMYMTYMNQESMERPNPGDMVSFGEMLDAVFKNQKLKEDVLSFTLSNSKINIGKSTDGKVKEHQILERVFKYLLDDGVLCFVNEGSLIYQFTGKLSFYYDIMDFIHEHDYEIKRIIESQNEMEQSQGSLL